MTPEIIPAILTSSLEEYASKLEVIEGIGAGWLHIDIADGHFVPSITVMPHEIGDMTTQLRQEVHLMTQRPERYFPDLTAIKTDRVLLHREVYGSLEACADALKHAADYFPEIGIVYNPDTALDPELAELRIDAVQCMGVQPGMSGQAFLPSTYDTIKAIAAMKTKAVIAVDGGVSEDNLEHLRSAGAQRFVMNSHLLKALDVGQRLQQFYQLIGGV